MRFGQKLTVMVAALGVGLSLILGASAAAQDTSAGASPAFSGKQLSAVPTDQWVANGGNVLNQRYSPLDQINRDNVSELKAEWRASLGGSGVKPRAGNQAAPLYYDGTLFIVTGDNDVFAIDVETGDIVWEYTANVDPEVARPCCSWAARGLAMGDGKIYLGRLDAKMVALDQETGEVVWEIQAADPAKGFSITSAPRYYDGMVITGFAGGDLGTRGRVDAYDAETGERVWRFYTIPGPGQVGHDTWPEDSDVWKYGGAAVWQTPAVDPELDLVYFATGNPGPVLNGAVREGDNLFSVSVVAVDAQTGEYVWHYQQVHHDIWDYDSSNPIILFDAEYNGEMRKGLAQAAKTGWVYLLDRETGEPLIGIPEKQVMQEPQQKTSPTQPHPIGDAVVPQKLDMPLQGFDLVNEGRIFTPYTDEKPVLWKPLAAVNWPASSYDPESKTMYICASDSFWGAQGGDPEYPIEPDQIYSGSMAARVNAPQRGIFAALDVTTNRIVWTQQWPDKCYSGSIVMAGGLVFVGRNDGRFQALDKATGDPLWEFQTDGGVNANAATFMYDGTQYVAVYAGGTALAPSKRSDGVWLFSLDGEMESLPRGAADRAGQFAGGDREAEIPDDRDADIAHGEEIYRLNCVACHGPNGSGGQHAAPLTDTLTVRDIVNVATNGRERMPAFGGQLSPEDLQDVAGYIREKLVAQ